MAHETMVQNLRIPRTIPSLWVIRKILVPMHEFRKCVYPRSIFPYLRKDLSKTINGSKETPEDKERPKVKSIEE